MSASCSTGFFATHGHSATAPRPKNVLQGPRQERRRLSQPASRDLDRTKIDAGIADEFARTLDRRIAEGDASGHAIDPGALRRAVRRVRHEPAHGSRSTRPDARNALIGELRGLLAASCVEALEPDLVILDEFQRFKHLLVDDPESEAASLARALFDWERPETGEHARVLMLSATPYRALTVAGDGGDDDHHEDFLATVRFLADSDARADELREPAARLPT